MRRFTQFAISSILCFLLLLVNVEVSAQSGTLPYSDLIVPSNNIRQYLITQAAGISKNSLSEVKTLEDWKSMRSNRQHQLAEMLGLGKYPVFDNRPPVKVTYVGSPQIHINN